MNLPPTAAATDKTFLRRLPRLTGWAAVVLLEEYQICPDSKLQRGTQIQIFLDGALVYGTLPLIDFPSSLPKRPNFEFLDPSNILILEDDYRNFYNKNKIGSLVIHPFVMKSIPFLNKNSIGIAQVPLRGDDFHRYEIFVGRGSREPAFALSVRRPKGNFSLESAKKSSRVNLFEILLDIMQAYQGSFTQDYQGAGFIPPLPQPQSMEAKRRGIMPSEISLQEQVLKTQKFVPVAISRNKEMQKIKDRY